MPAPDRSADRLTLLIGGTIAAAALLRLPGLNSSLWYDEIVTLVTSVRKPAAQIVTEFSGVNQHPLYSLFAHGAIEVFGETPWAVRLPAVIFGVLAILMAYRLATLLMTRLEAWAGAAVLATSYHHVWFSQNARGYTLLAFLVAASTLFLLRANRTHDRRDYAFYVIANAAGIYTHLTMALVVAGHIAVIAGGRLLRWQPALDYRIQPLTRAWLATSLIAVVLYAPFASDLAAIMQANEHVEDARVATIGWAISELLRSSVSTTGTLVSLVSGALAAFGLISLWRRQALPVALLIVPGLVVAAAVAALGQPFRPRFFFFLTTAGAVGIGRSLGALKTNATLAIVFVISVASLPGLATNYRVPKQDFDGAVRFLEEQEAQGATIAAASAACRPFEVYYGRKWLCVERADQWPAAGTQQKVLIAHTLTEYVQDPQLQEFLRSGCPVIRRFPGTLSGGDIVVCEVRTNVQP